MKDDEKAALKFLSYLLPLTFIPLGLPLALKLISPNGAYGIRTTRTLESPSIWYSVNFVGGVSLMLAGLLSIMLISLLYRGSKAGPLIKLVLSFVVSIVFLIVAIGFAFWVG